MGGGGSPAEKPFCSQVKKLVYVYLVRYAEEQQDLALLSISTFQRGLKVSSPPGPGLAGATLEGQPRERPVRGGRSWRPFPVRLDLGGSESDKRTGAAVVLSVGGGWSKPTARKELL